MEGEHRQGGGPTAFAPLRVNLLGRFEVVRADAPVPASAWRRRRPADLLKLVALAPGRVLARDVIIDTLWPDKDPSSGANNLHRALYDLRQILGARYVDIERGQVALVPEAWVDVDAFEAAADAGGPEGHGAAVALYRGDLCPEDLDAPWLSARRALLRGRFAESALPLARSAADRGDAVALPLLRRILAAEPASEEAHLLLVRLLAESGRRAEALRQCDTCEAALRSVAAGPPEALRELRGAIQRGDIGQAPARAVLDGARRAARRLLGTPDPGPVRGRSGLVLLIESVLEAGHGVLVLLGERGVGKTRLAVEGARLAHSRGAVVLSGVASARGAGGEPYALFADVFLAERRHRPEAPDPLAALPAGAGVAGEATRRRVYEAIEGGLRELAGGKPIYLLLDGLHEADESSLDLLHVLARRARELQLVVVATCNEEALHAGTPVQATLTHLDGARLARGVRLPRLGITAVRELVADLLGEPPPEPLVEQLYRLTDGSPLAAEELVRARREEPGVLLPADAAAAIRARSARLGPAAGTLLAAAAVAGPRFEFELVRTVSGLTAHEALDALERALAARLVDEDGAGYHFHHALVHEVLYDAVAPDRRAALHAAIADALEAGAGGAEPAPELLAHHRLRAGRPEQALRQLVAAGHRAAARAGLREAHAFYAEALRLLGRDGGGEPQLQLEVLEALGRVQLGLGEISGAARAFADAARVDPDGIEHEDPERRARNHRLAAVALASGGALRAAASEVGEGLEAAGASPGDEGPSLLLLRARLAWHEGKLTEARADAEGCAERADAIGEQALAMRARDLAAVVAASAPAGAPPAGEVPLAPFPAGVDEDVRPDLDLDLVLWERDLLGDRTAADLGRAAAAYAERMRARGRPDAAAVGRHGTGVAALAAGDLELAGADLAEALRGHRAAGSSLGEALALERLGTLATIRGQFGEALALLDEGVLAAERAFIRRHALTRIYTTLARTRLASGAVYAAEDAVREASVSAARRGTCFTCDAALRATAVRVSLARGRVADAQAEAGQLEEVARQRGGRVLVAVARLARARVLAAEGRTADALGALLAARNAFFFAGHRHDAAICARIEKRLRDPAEPLPGDVALLEKLVLADGDA